VLNFDLRVETEGSKVLVTVEGDFDIQVAERVAVELTRLESTEPELLVLDLHGLTFLDSSGMGVIAAAHARATAAARRFAVVTPRPGVVRAFRISGLAEVVPMVQDRAEVYP
jgi:stage II sporulation protein AA (anti-sigma F factor antagonist)